MMFEMQFKILADLRMALGALTKREREREGERGVNRKLLFSNH